jgi:hypothetical protein
MNADGTESAQLVPASTGFSVFTSDWSPDSKSLLYVQSTAGGNITDQLYVVGAATGSQPVKLNTGNTQERSGRWVSNSKIAFSNDQNIIIVNSDGSNATNLTNFGPGLIGGSLPTPDGKTILFDRKDTNSDLAVWSVLIGNGISIQVTHPTKTVSGAITTSTSDAEESISTDGITIGFERSIQVIQDSTVTITSQVGTVKLDGSDMHLFNAPNAQHAHAAALSTAICH